MTRQQAIKKYNLTKDYNGGIDWKTETYSSDTVKNGIRTVYCLTYDELALSEGVLQSFLTVQKWDLNRTDENGFPKGIYNRVYAMAE